MPNTKTEKHTNPIITQIQLPSGSVYDIHDSTALHSIEDLELATVLTFAGIDTAENILGKTSAKKGEVWLCSNTTGIYVGVEFVCIETFSGAADTSKWQKLGNIHDAASSTHTHDEVVVTGTNSTSKVTGTVAVPKLVGEDYYLKLQVDKQEHVTTNTIGENATLTTSVTPTTQYIGATASGTALKTEGSTFLTSVTPVTEGGAVLGQKTTFKTTGGGKTYKELNTLEKSLATVDKDSCNAITEDSDGKIESGTSAEWTGTVAGGKLIIGWKENSPTKVTLPTFKKSNAVTGSNSTIVYANGTLKDSTKTDGNVIIGAIADIGVEIDNMDKVTALTGVSVEDSSALISAEVQNQPTIKLSIDNATGANKASIVTGIDRATTSWNNKDLVSAVTTVNEQTVDLISTGTPDKDTIRIPLIDLDAGTEDIEIKNGLAAAQTWTQTEGYTGQPTKNS